MVVNERISALRGEMARHKIDAYVVPSGDYHQSEYVGEHFGARAYVTGFTGSVGTAVVAMDDAALWVDGRYYIQAEHQLEGSGVRMYKLGVDGVDTIEDYLAKTVPQGGRVGFDGRVMACEEGRRYAAKLDELAVRVDISHDLVACIWADRPALPHNPVFSLDVKYTGEATTSKLARLREKMRNEGATYHVVSTLDDIAWLLNLRGTETPLFLAYVIVGEYCATLYIDDSKFCRDAKIRSELERDGFCVKPYDAVYADVAALELGSVVLLDPERVNYSIANAIPVGCKVVECFNPTLLMKACKNDTELQNIRAAHIKDGVAQTKFMHWLKTSVGKIDITEITAGEKLTELRREQLGFIWPSFPPIVAYREHAAMMHYRAEPGTQKAIHAEHILLTDSGGHYLEGSTDITRTYVLGEVSHEIKTHFTAVVRGMVNLSRTKFLKGVRGPNLDVIARQPLWEVGVDYKSGTGHGVGYVTTVHEAPCAIRWQIPEDRPVQPPLDAGMVLSNEPGAYVQGSHGIRIENELIVCESHKNEHGQFMCFETITLSPIDLDAIVPEMLLPAEKAALNAYHQQVRDTIAPYLDDEQREWLGRYTREIL